MKPSKATVRLHSGAAGRQPIFREFAIAESQSLLLRFAPSAMCKDGSRLPDYKAFVGDKRLDPAAPISALLGVDRDDAGLVVQIYFYDKSAFKMGDNDALTTTTKEIISNTTAATRAL